MRLKKCLRANSDSNLIKTPNAIFLQRSFIGFLGFFCEIWDWTSKPFVHLYWPSMYIRSQFGENLSSTFP